MNTTLLDDMSSSVTGRPELCIGFGIIGSRRMAHCNAQCGERFATWGLATGPAVRYVTCLTCECDTTIWHQDQNLTTRTTTATNQSQCQCHRDGGGGGTGEQKRRHLEIFSMNCLTKLKKHDKLNCKKPELSWCRVSCGVQTLMGPCFYPPTCLVCCWKLSTGYTLTSVPLPSQRASPIWVAI